MSGKRSRGSIWAWLVVLGCIGFYSIPTGIIGNTSGIYVAPVMDQFGWTQTDTTMYRTIQPLVAAICAPFAGRIMTKFNPRWVLALVTAAFGLASMASSFAVEVWQWNLYGVVFGVTSAFFMYLAAPVLINAWFEKRTGFAISITAATLSILAAIASPIGQQLISSFDWQTSRLILSTFSTLLSIILTIAFVRKNPEIMGLTPFGAKDTETQTASSPKSAQKNEKGATIAQAIRSPGLYLLIFVCGIIVMCAAFFQQIPAYCARTELGAGAGAMAVSIIMIGGVIGKLLLGVLNDIIGVKYTGLISMFGGALGIALAYFAGANVVVFYGGMVIFGFGYAGLTVIAPMLARASFGSINYTQIYSWVSMGIFVATAISFFIYATIYDFTQSYDLCFFLVIGMYLLGAIIIPLTIRFSNASWKGKNS
ncbi:MAG: MFS transporter [Coriobacteriales bacterium]|nr:MFS transporter [Coriobacteriales bacterium]